MIRSPYMTLREGARGGPRTRPQRTTFGQYKGSALYDFWLIEEPPQHRSRAVLETPVILEIEGIEAGEVPLISSIPKSLQISTRTSIGPMVVRISESAALELTEALATHWQVRGSQ